LRVVLRLNSCFLIVKVICIDKKYFPQIGFILG
jgi:hypothetical protein